MANKELFVLKIARTEYPLTKLTATAAFAIELQLDGLLTKAVQHLQKSITQ
jgi:hypothetical protein